MSVFATTTQNHALSVTTDEGIFYIGLMSGTSVDGVDGALVQINPSSAHNGDQLRTLASHYLPFDENLRHALLALQDSGPDEIHREALAANALAQVYAQVVTALLEKSGIAAAAVCAIGAHGQTIRHRPELGYTRQINSPALLAELTGIDVIADFRSRDVAAGGLGAPLAPAFHEAVFSQPGQVRVLLNAGGIANITVLDRKNTITDTDTVLTPGFDTGPANVLMDGWIMRHRGQRYDADGLWAGSGQVNLPLLEQMLAEPYFSLPSPKATGRDLFNDAWLDGILAQPAIALLQISPADVQATLLALTARSVCLAIKGCAANATELFVCGGGAYNPALLAALRQQAADAGLRLTVQTTATLGIAPEQVEALAFAWLASRFVTRRPGNLTSVTGARHPAILGALYPA